MRYDTPTHCHCGTAYGGSDHCPVCGCEQYEARCDHVSRFAIAHQYEQQCAVVFGHARAGAPSSAAHGEAIRCLARIARKLHAAEREAGVPMGSTREHRASLHAQIDARRAA